MPSNIPSGKMIAAKSSARSSIRESEMYDFSVLRELRKREGMSIVGVSSQSGVSPTVISKLERNQTVAELETLFKLARVFGMSATDLVALAESRTAHKQQSSVHKWGGFEFDAIQYSNARALRGRALAGACVSRPEVHRDDYEICWVLKGRIRFRLPAETHELGSGEAIQFDAILDHTYEALEDCEIFIIHLRKDKRF